MNLLSEPVPRKASASPIWIAAAGGLLMVLALVAAGQGTLVRLAVPATALLVGLLLYARRPVGYVHFVLWTWFLTPLARRLVDWRLGFEDHNLILIAPVLVSAIAALTLLRERRFATPQLITPFLLCIAGVTYGFIVGMVRWRLHVSEATSAGEIVYALFEWVAPLLFGLHLYLRWPMYEEHKNAVQRTFLIGTLLLGAYGIYQYVNPPAWDKVWLEHVMTELGVTAFGRPEPFQVRIWSTANSPGFFANILMAALLFLFSVKSRAKALAMGIGYSAFLLTLVRTSWLGWVVGLGILAKDSEGGQIRRLLLSVAFVPALVAPLMLNPVIATAITDRIQTMQSTKQDESFQDRSEEYRALVFDFLRDPFGEGLNNQLNFHGYTMDSGFLKLLYSCGWIGTGLFLAGIGMCLCRMPSDRKSNDQLTSVYRAILFATVFEMLSGSVFTGPSAGIAWTCIGLSFSYHQVQAATSVQVRLEPAPRPGSSQHAVA